jgi:hypothetical protein
MTGRAILCVIGGVSGARCCSRIADAAHSLLFFLPKLNIERLSSVNTSGWINNLPAAASSL